MPDLFRNSERRAHPRVEARVEVRFSSVADAAKNLTAFSVNFSAGGLCLKTVVPRALGERLKLSLTIEAQQFEIDGEVTWLHKDTVGVRFVSVPPNDRDRLEAVARSLLSRLPALP